MNDTRLDPDFISLDNENTLSEIIVPIMQQGQIKGIVEICSEDVNAFSGMDVTIVEGVASELTRAWERSSYNQRLTELIQAGKHWVRGSYSLHCLTSREIFPVPHLQVMHQNY